VTVREGKGIVASRKFEPAPKPAVPSKLGRKP